MALPERVVACEACPRHSVLLTAEGAVWEVRWFAPDQPPASPLCVWRPPSDRQG